MIVGSLIWFKEDWSRWEPSSLLAFAMLGLAGESCTLPYNGEHKTQPGPAAALTAGPPNLRQDDGHVFSSYVCSGFLLFKVPDFVAACGGLPGKEH